MATKRVSSKRKTIVKQHVKAHKNKKMAAAHSHLKSKASSKQSKPAKQSAKALASDSGLSSKAGAKLLKQYLANAAFSEYLMGLGGENASKVLITMDGAMSDEEIARNAKLKVSEVRSVLNKLHGQGIATYERTRDKDTGWYYYKWSLNHGAMEGAAAKGKAGMNSAAAVEGAGNIYACPSCVQEKYPFETALDYLFKCPQCGSSLDYAESKLAKK
jgi:transcription initiation factor TFIIE subunit alpha